MSVKHQIKTAYETLKAQSDLSPNNAAVNINLSNLVEQLSIAREHGYEDHIVCDDTLHQERLELPFLCGEAECEMEKYWARHFLEKERLSPADLTEFWYYEHYKDLWHAEQELMAGTDKTKRVIFLGSGALPLTIILGAIHSPNFKAVCVDFDTEAVNLSKALIKRLDLQEQIQVQCVYAQEFGFKSDDFVICASLIKDKVEVYKTFYKAGIAQFSLRDVEGCYCYLYTPSEKPLSQHYTEILRTKPSKTCINTTRLFAKTFAH